MGILGNKCKYIFKWKIFSLLSLGIEQNISDIKDYFAIFGNDARKRTRQAVNYKLFRIKMIVANFTLSRHLYQQTLTNLLKPFFSINNQYISTSVLVLSGMLSM